mmetsp:Transcript_28441/g.69336  ORF Transcript_28441/g.69336 Transcript_28441/m.69336 type:complete len:200 (+) Transcript_28441:600-1199(+)
MLKTAIDCSIVLQHADIKVISPSVAQNITNATRKNLGNLFHPISTIPHTIVAKTALATTDTISPTPLFTRKYGSVVYKLSVRSRFSINLSPKKDGRETMALILVIARAMYPKAGTYSGFTRKYIIPISSPMTTAFAAFAVIFWGSRMFNLISRSNSCHSCFESGAVTMLFGRYEIVSFTLTPCSKLSICLSTSGFTLLS